METRGRYLKLLITGASGLLGSKISELAIGKNCQVYSAYNQDKPLHGAPIQFDISDGKTVETILEKIKPDVVVHAASLTDVDKCELEKELAWKVNVEGTKAIAESCKKYQAFLIYISTDYVFDGEKGMYTENDNPAPINYYGLTKLKAEEHVNASTDEHCIARTSVIYGSIPAAGKVNFSLWLLNKLKKKEAVKIVTDQWTSPTLNTNLAYMILEIMERRIVGIYHLAGATRINRYDFSKLIAQTFNLDATLLMPSLSKEFPWVAKRPRDSSLDTKKAQRTLKNKPLKIEQALKKMKEEMQ